MRCTWIGHSQETCRWIYTSKELMERISSIKLNKQWHDIKYTPKNFMRYWELDEFRSLNNLPTDYQWAAIEDFFKTLVNEQTDDDYYWKCFYKSVTKNKRPEYGKNFEIYRKDYNESNDVRGKKNENDNIRDSFKPWDKNGKWGDSMTWDDEMISKFDENYQNKMNKRENLYGNNFNQTNTSQRLDNEKNMSNFNDSYQYGGYGKGYGRGYKRGYGRGYERGYGSQQYGTSYGGRGYGRGYERDFGRNPYIENVRPYTGLHDRGRGWRGRTGPWTGNYRGRSRGFRGRGYRGSRSRGGGYYRGQFNRNSARGRGRGRGVIDTNDDDWMKKMLKDNGN